MSDSLEKLKPSITVNLLGKERSFRFSLKSCAQFQKLTKKSLLSGGIDIYDAEGLATLLWAGLIPDNKEFDGRIDSDGKPDETIQKTIDNLLESLDLTDYAYLVNEVIGKAIQLAQPKEDPKKKGK